MELNVKLDQLAYLPERAHPTDAGLDLRTPHDVLVMPGVGAVVDTGVHIQLPAGTVGMLKSKSGLNVKHGIVSEGVIDEATRARFWSSSITTAHGRCNSAGATRSLSWWCCRWRTPMWSRRRRSPAAPGGMTDMGARDDDGPRTKGH